MQFFFFSECMEKGISSALIIQRCFLSLSLRFFFFFFFHLDLCYYFAPSISFVCLWFGAPSFSAVKQGIITQYNIVNIYLSYLFLFIYSFFSLFLPIFLFTVSPYSHHISSVLFCFFFYTSDASLSQLQFQISKQEKLSEEV